MKDFFVNDWGDDFEGQSGFFVKNDIKMLWHLHFDDVSNEIYGKLGLYDEDGKNGVRFDIRKDLQMDWEEDSGYEVFNKFKDVIENKKLISTNIKDMFIEIKENMKIGTKQFSIQELKADTGSTEIKPRNHKLELYLSGIRIETIDDFKREMKTLTHHFPDEFGKDSIKCAGAILEYADKETREKINFSLRTLGCSNMINTKRLMDSWAANGVQSPSRDLKAIRGKSMRERMDEAMSW
jgi:hypothetical protein